MRDPALEIDVNELARRLESNEPVVLVDVRQLWENQRAALPQSRLIPLNTLAERAGEIPADAGLVVIYCHLGVRSLMAAQYVKQQLGLDNVRSLAGGIDAWSRLIDPSIPRY